MKSKEFDDGIYKIKLTFYRTGNVHICFVNRITREAKVLLVKNPLVFHKKVETIRYAI